MDISDNVSNSELKIMPPLKAVNLVVGKGGKIEVEQDKKNSPTIILSKPTVESKVLVATATEQDTLVEVTKTIDALSVKTENAETEPSEDSAEVKRVVSRLSITSKSFVPTNNITWTKCGLEETFPDEADSKSQAQGDAQNYRAFVPPGETSIRAFISTDGTNQVSLESSAGNSFTQTSITSSEYRTRSLNTYISRITRTAGDGRLTSPSKLGEGYSRLCYIKPSSIGTERVVVVPSTPSTPTQEFIEAGMLRPILGGSTGKGNKSQSTYNSLMQQQLQKQEIRESIGDNVKPYLLFKNLPPMLNRRGLFGLCSPYGQVVEVRNHNNEYMTVSFATINDMINVFRILERNVYGFQVEIGKKLPETKVEKELKKLFTKTPIIKNIESDFQSRCEVSLSPTKKPERPIFTEKPIVTHDDYAAKNNLLQSNDPKKFYLYERDYHTSEHLALEALNGIQTRKPQVYYRTGRAYIPRTPVVLNKENIYQLTTNNTQASGFVDTIKRNFLNCLMCGDFSKYSCSNCSSSYYCSYKCQKSDWQRHRSTCSKQQILPPPPFVLTNAKDDGGANKINEPLASKLKKLMPVGPLKPQTEKYVEIHMMPSMSTVTITSVAKTNTVFIRPKSTELNEIYRQTINKIQSACFRKLYCAPVLGQIVVAKFEGIFNRAMVINVENLNAICVVHMDFGNLDKKHITELYDCPEYYITLPRLVVPVILKRVPEFFMTEQVRKYLYSYLDHGSLTLKYDEVKDFNDRVGVYEVELFDQRKDIFLNDVLEKICTPLAGVKLTGDRRYFTRHYLRQNILPVGENIELLVMDNSNLDNGFVSCTVIPYAFEIHKFNFDIQRYAEMFTNFRHEPQPDELVIARYDKDKRWYRGRCIKAISGVFPVIQYIDYGNMEVVSCENLLPYPKEFTFPIYTADCVIDGLPPKCNAELTKRLESLLVIGAIVRCNKIELYRSENYYKITLNEVVKMFKIQGFLD